MVSKADCTAATNRFRVSEFPLAKLKTCRNHWLPVRCTDQVEATRPVETRARTAVSRLWRSSQAVVPQAGPANWVEWAGACQWLWVPVQISQIAGCVMWHPPTHSPPPGHADKLKCGRMKSRHCSKRMI